MPYLILPREELDGGFGYVWVDKDYTPETGEVVVESEPDPGSEVWDATTQSLREKTAAERLEEAKQARIGDFAGRAVEDLDATGLFTEDHGDRETLFATAKTLAAVCTQLGIPLDPRLASIVATGDKAMSKKAQIEAAATEAELEGITWT